jgi:HIV Tat-specific factor 1
VIAEEIDSGRPRIKLYTDDSGAFKGDALIVFFKAPSVNMAITLLDDTDFRYSDLGGSGKMRVMAADSSYKKTKAEEGSGTTSTADKEAARERAKTSARDKAKIIKKTQKLDARLADWDDDDPSVLYEAGPKPQKLVVLKHMFTLQELEEDPAAMLDIKEDIREECAKLGEVTNVVLFDLEEAGVASVRFRDEAAAAECVRVMNGRSFAGQTVEAYLSEGKEGFKKSKAKAQEGEEGEHA